MDQAFAAVWHMLRADDFFRDFANDTELRKAIGKKLVKLVVDGVTDPLQLRNLTVESLLLAAPLRRASSVDAARREKGETGCRFLTALQSWSSMIRRCGTSSTTHLVFGVRAAPDAFRYLDP